MLPGDQRILVANSGVRQAGQTSQARQTSQPGRTPRSSQASLAVIDARAALAGRPALVGVIGAGILPREFAVVPGGRTALVTNSASHQLEAVNVSPLG
jgi:hypothetical protein